MAENGASPLTPLARAERFIWLTARVLEQRRFAHHFRDGEADAVQTALAAYLNEDGGYGHALHPELRGPVSQPLHTAHALSVLDLIGRCGGPHIERVCRYLTRVSTPDGALPAVHPSLRGHPAAPWVSVTDEPPSSLLTTGPVVGLLHRNAVWHAWLFRATDFCWQAVESMEKPRPHEVLAALHFLEGVPDRPRAAAAARRLGTLVREQGLAAVEPYGTAGLPAAEGCVPGEAHFAYDFAAAPGAPARRWFTDAEMDRALDHLASLQEDDGGWPVTGRTWAPGGTLEFRPVITIRSLLTLRAYGRAIG
ncbi:hypothetical protein [Streptomyces sp. NPDC003077]|uniref:hypothetical protein n=1 Tax=Streptomyces sp. NPDC003077 TaxID=3154443 RepID=UPI0033BDBE33